MAEKTDQFGREWTVGVPRSDTYLNAAVVDILRSSISGSSVLDVGCGNGSLCRRIADNGYTVAGVDWDPSAINLASKLVPEGNFEVARFSDRPPATDFDAVVSTEVIEHLFDPRELLSFAFNALKPGGILVLSTPYHGYLKNLAISVVDGWDEHFMPNVLAGHIKFFSLKTLTKSLQDAGFAVTNFRGAGRVPLLWKSMIIVAKKNP